MEDDRRHWHLDKRVSIGHLLTTLSVAGVVFAWVLSVEQKTEKNTADITHVREIMSIQNQHITEKMEAIRKGVNNLDLKMDRLINRVNGEGHER